MRGHLFLFPPHAFIEHLIVKGILLGTLEKRKKWNLSETGFWKERNYFCILVNLLISCIFEAF